MVTKIHVIVYAVAPKEVAQQVVIKRWLPILEEYEKTKAMDYAFAC